jgi:hypothetical protein
MPVSLAIALPDASVQSDSLRDVSLVSPFPGLILIPSERLPEMVRGRRCAADNVARGPCLFSSSLIANSSFIGRRLSAAHVRSDEATLNAIVSCSGSSDDHSRTMRETVDDQTSNDAIAGLDSQTRLDCYGR